MSAVGQRAQSSATRMAMSTATQANLLPVATPPRNSSVTGREITAAVMASCLCPLPHLPHLFPVHELPFRCPQNRVRLDPPEPALRLMEIVVLCRPTRCCRPSSNSLSDDSQYHCQNQQQTYSILYVYDNSGPSVLQPLCYIWNDQANGQQSKCLPGVKGKMPQ
jgi:hypothetical protein